MWEPRHVTTLWASTVRYRDSFTFTFTFVWRQHIYFYFASRSTLGLTQPRIQWILGTLSPGEIGQRVRVITHIHFVQRVIILGTIRHSSVVIVEWCIIKHKGTFNVTVNFCAITIVFLYITRRPTALYPPERFLVLIPVRGRVNPGAIIRLEGLGKLKSPMTSSGSNPRTFRLVP
jgi:hypothetical protein